jgi:hypothetical protein
MKQPEDLRKKEVSLPPHNMLRDTVTVTSSPSLTAGISFCDEQKLEIMMTAPKKAD